MKKQQTKEEALRSSWAVLIVLWAIGCACLIFGLIVREFLDFAGIIAAIMILVGPYLLITTRKRIKRSYCPSCATAYDYQKDISWEETEEMETDNKQTAVVEFVCHCRKCNEKTIFTKKFVVASYDKNKNTWKYNNVETLARKYFWN